MATRVEVWPCGKGTLETDLKRAKAWDITEALQARLAAQTTYGQTPETRISFGAAIELLDNVEIIMAHLAEYVELKKQEPKE